MRAENKQINLIGCETAGINVQTNTAATWVKMYVLYLLQFQLEMLPGLSFNKDLNDFWMSCNWVDCSLSQKFDGITWRYVRYYLQLYVPEFLQYAILLAYLGIEISHVTGVTYHKTSNGPS